MELSVKNYSGVPSDAIVSVRSGTTRRQAPLEKATSSAFKFRMPLEEASSEPLQIDVLQQLCSVPLVLQPHCPAYHIGLGHSDMSLELNVKATQNGDASKQSPPAPAASAASSANAQYVEEHGLLRYVQATLNALVHAQPEDPYAFMKQQLRAARGASPADAAPPAQPPAAQPAIQQPAAQQPALPLQPARRAQEKAAEAQEATSAPASRPLVERPSGYVHRKCRSAHPHLPERFAVSDEHVLWSVPMPDYKPTAYSDASLETAGWADPADAGSMREELSRRRSHEGPVRLEQDSGFPINPVGRTGMRDRGVLGKWGPNHAADPIVTRLEPGTGRLQVVVIKRRDTGSWALPGGMVDPGETVSATVRREFEEEAGNFEGDEERAREFARLTAQLFDSGRLVYRGYVDDPRNTDTSWLESVVLHFHCDARLGEMLPLKAGDDAVQVRWLNVDHQETDYQNLYASHRDWVDAVAEQIGTESNATV